MDLGTYESAYDGAAVSWLENAMEHARARNQGKLLSCLECVRNELIEMARETRLATRP